MYAWWLERIPRGDRHVQMKEAFLVHSIRRTLNHSFDRVYPIFIFRPRAHTRRRFPFEHAQLPLQPRQCLRPEPALMAFLIFAAFHSAVPCRAVRAPKLELKQTSATVMARNSFGKTRYVTSPLSRSLSIFFCHSLAKRCFRAQHI